MQALDQFVRDTCSLANDPEAKFLYVKFLRLSIAVMKELNLFIIPNMVTIDCPVGINGTIPMPSDTIEPKFVALIHQCNNKTYLLPFGHRERRRATKLTFASCPTEDSNPPSNCPDLTLYNYTGELLHPFYVWNPFYLENYGKRTTRFYGFWDFIAEENRIELMGNTTEGNRFIITYKSMNDDMKLIPEDVVPAAQERVLQKHWAGTDPGKALYYERQFKINLRMFKHNRLNNYSAEDWLDMITGQYSNAVR